jgi:hypothetical protein
MEVKMKRFFFYIFLFQITNAQLLTESFYGLTVDQSLSNQNNWSSDPNATNIIVRSGSLSFDGYPPSLGDKVEVTTGSNNVALTKTLSQTITSGSIYISFLIKINSFSTTAADVYFIGFKTGNNAHRPRLLIKNNNANTFFFGISKVEGDRSYTSNSFNKNTTYLVVMKYTFLSGDNNDKVDLFINPDPISSEPATPNLTHTSGTDASSFDNIFIRQTKNSGTNLEIDEIRVATSWDQAPLPVTLNNFDFYTIKNQVILTWQTATEVNNYGFEIERKYSGPADVINNSWEKIGFVQGNGNSNSPKYYSFIDKNLLSGYYSYRL